MLPGFEEVAPLERPIIEQRYMMLTEDAMLGGTYRSMRFAEPPTTRTACSAPRSIAGTRRRRKRPARGLSEFTVTDLLWEDGQVVGVTTGEPEGELYANVVVLADGATPTGSKGGVA